MHRIKQQSIDRSIDPAKSQRGATQAKLAAMPGRATDSRTRRSGRRGADAEALAAVPAKSPGTSSPLATATTSATSPSPSSTVTMSSQIGAPQTVQKHPHVQQQQDCHQNVQNNRHQSHGGDHAEVRKLAASRNDVGV